MKAVGYRSAGPIDRDAALVDIELPDPIPTGHDLLIDVKAVSVNPVDTKIRASVDAAGDTWKVLGWDAVGTVAARGERASRFEIGDRVFYAGSITRPGTNSQLHLVDERIVGRKPENLSDAEAAALPLTSITAWEMLFDRLRINDADTMGTNTILIIGGAGGVGSIAIQLVRALTRLEIIAAASRPETQSWVRALGAHHVINHREPLDVINHREPLAEQIRGLGIKAPSFVFSTTETQSHLNDIVELIAPEGRFGLIDDPATLDVVPFKRKSVSIHWELMFTRSLFATSNMDHQGRLLNDVARLADAGALRSTATEVLHPINAANLRQAHRWIESGTAKGKIVLAGF